MLCYKGFKQVSERLSQRAESRDLLLPPFLFLDSLWIRLSCHLPPVGGILRGNQHILSFSSHHDFRIHKVKCEVATQKDEWKPLVRRCFLTAVSLVSFILFHEPPS